MTVRFSRLAWLQLWALVLLALSVALLALLALQSHSALCTFKDDLETRRDTTRAFIESHHEGIPGISRADLDRSLAGQEATLRSLGSLDRPWPFGCW